MATTGNFNEAFTQLGDTHALILSMRGVRHTLQQGGLIEEIGEENFFWSSDQAIVEAERRGCEFCKAEQK